MKGNETQQRQIMRKRNVTPTIEKRINRYLKVIFLSNLAIIIVAIITCKRLITLIMKIILIDNIIFNNYTHTHTFTFTYNNNNIDKEKYEIEIKKINN